MLPVHGEGLTPEGRVEHHHVEDTLVFFDSLICSLNRLAWRKPLHFLLIHISYLLLA